MNSDKEKKGDEMVEDYAIVAAAAVCLPQNSGRTEAMLEDALEAAGPHHTIWIVAANAGERERLRELFFQKSGGEAVLHESDNSVVYAGTRFRFSSIWDELQGAATQGRMPRQPRYVDHAAIEGLIRKFASPTT